MCVKNNENNSILYVPHLDAIQNSNTHIKFVHYQLIFVYKIISNWYENVVGFLILKPI